jgi:hypothetical protein
MVEGGSKCVVFDPWAWQALGQFADSMTVDRRGDDLAAYRRLCGLSLTPSGVTPEQTASPSGRAQLLSYQARNGNVEMVLSTDGNGKASVQVTTFGIPTASGEPTVKAFFLPPLTPKTTT